MTPILVKPVAILIALFVSLIIGVAIGWVMRGEIGEPTDEWRKYIKHDDV